MSTNQSKQKPKSRLLRRRPSKSQEALARIAELEAKVAAFESRLSKMEKSNDNPFIGDKNPYTPPTPYTPYPDTIPWQKYPYRFHEEPKCHVCGLKWSDMTHYVCNHPSCPNRVTVTATDMTSGLKGQTPYTTTTTTAGMNTFIGGNPITLSPNTP
jgi:hypothetical protein